MYHEPENSSGIETLNVTDGVIENNGHQPVDLLMPLLVGFVFIIQAHKHSKPQRYSIFSHISKYMPHNENLRAPSSTAFAEPAF